MDNGRKNNPQTVAIAGATGMIGSHLIQALQARGQHVIALVRTPEQATFPQGVEVRRWQASDPAAPVQDADAVINLVGQPIFASRWTPARKHDLLQTRLLATRSLVAGIRQTDGVQTLVSTSAIEYAGDTGNQEIDEGASAGKGFLAEMSQQWEAEAQAVENTGVRLVILRQSLVLGREGGVLAGLLPAYRSGFGGTLGRGNQWFSWIHIDDAVGLILHALDTGITGPLVSASPYPVTSKDFTHVFAQAVHRPTFFPMPDPVMTLFWGERSALFKDSHRMVPRVALQTGFQFRFPTLQSALVDLV